jgi:hypothetical protein
MTKESAEGGFLRHKINNGTVPEGTVPFKKQNPPGRKYPGGWAPQSPPKEEWISAIRHRSIQKAKSAGKKIPRRVGSLEPPQRRMDLCH